MLGSYIRQNMRFFVAKVNLAEQAKLGYSYLRPLQVAYESPKFMLPIRLGMVNANGPQELFVYALTRNGRVETTNYRTVKLPTGMDMPLVREGRSSAAFYKAMFAEQVATRRHARGVPRIRVGHELVRPVRGRSAVARRAAQARRVLARRSGGPRRHQAVRAGGRQARERVRHAPARALRPAHFPEDLVFQETGDRANFQGRYVLRHPWAGGDACEAARRYLVDPAGLATSERPRRSHP